VKLKVPKLNWKQKVDKLRRIVLSGPAIEELPPGMLAMLEAWRGHTHGKLTDDEYMRIMQANLGDTGERLIWEPYSDARGEVEVFYGWHFQATLFGVNGQPWWFVKAWRENAAEPTEQQFQMIEKAIELLGCHDTERDMIREFPDEAERWTMFWSWFHTGPLLEMQFHPKTHHMLVVNEGTPLKAGYMRMDRISRFTEEAHFSTNAKKEDA
jgi:hypothetical protein